MRVKPIVFVKLIIFVTLFFFIEKGFEYILNDDTNSYTRIMMHELYDMDKVNVLFAGSSHSFMSAVPDVADSELEVCSFNLGTSAQNMDGTYALIVEANKKNDIETVFLEVYYGVIGAKKVEDRPDLISTYAITDYMKPSFNKYRFLFSAGSKKHWINDVFISRRYWEKMFEKGYVKDVIQKKNCEAYRAYQPPAINESNQQYIERGYVANLSALENEAFMDKRAFGAINLANVDDSLWKKYMNRIVEYCRKNSIELVFYIAPEPQLTLLGKRNYDEYYSYMLKYTSNNNIPFYDFNLCRMEYFDTTDISNFADADHLSDKGAKEFTKLLCNIYKENSRVEDVFFKSFDEKVASEKKNVRGIAFNGEQKGLECWDCYVISRNYDKEEYEIIASPQSGNSYTVEQISEGYFKIPSSEHGELLIKWHDSFDTDEFGEFSVTY